MQAKACEGKNERAKMYGAWPWLTIAFKNQWRISTANPVAKHIKYVKAYEPVAGTKHPLLLRRRPHRVVNMKRKGPVSTRFSAYAGTRPNRTAFLQSKVLLPAPGLSKISRAWHRHRCKLANPFAKFQRTRHKQCLASVR